MEQLSQFTFRLLLLFIPGVIVFFIARKLTAHKDTPFHWAFIEIFLYGLLSYSVFVIYISFLNLTIYSIVAGLDNIKYIVVDFKFVNSIVHHNTDVPLDEVFQTSLLALILSLIIAKAISKRWFYMFALKLRVSDQIGDSWSFAMWKADWIRIYDSKEDRIYQGRVSIYSYASEKTELLLTSVKIFQKSTGNELRKIDALFIRKDTEEIVIELINWPNIQKLKGDKENDRRKTQKNG